MGGGKKRGRVEGGAEMRACMFGARSVARGGATGGAWRGGTFQVLDFTWSSLRSSFVPWAFPSPGGGCGPLSRASDLSSDLTGRRSRLP